MVLIGGFSQEQYLNRRLMTNFSNRVSVSLVLGSFGGAFLARGNLGDSVFGQAIVIEELSF